MERLMSWAMRYRTLVLTLVAAISVVAAAYLPQLEIAISPQSLIIEGDPEQQFYEDTLRTFGSDRITIIYLSDPRLFEPEKLEAVRDVIDAIELLPFVVRTRSLFNMSDLRLEEDLVSTKSFLSEAPSDLEAASAVIERALRNPFIKRNLLADDGRSMAINVYLRNDAAYQDPTFDMYVAQEISHAIAPLNTMLEQAYQIGLPYVRTAIADIVSDEQLQTIGASLAVLAASLLVLFRRISAAIIPIITSGLSILWLLGAMAIAGTPLTVLTAIVPVLLVIVGSTEDVHLLAEVYEGQRDGLSLRRAIRRTIRRLALAIGLTFLTSYLGFLAIGANPINLVREFGIVASSGLAINFLLTVILVPVLLDCVGHRKSARVKRSVSRFYELVSDIITEFILKFRRTVLLASALLLSVLLYLGSSVQVNNDILSYFDSESPIQERVQILRDQLAGLYTLQVVVDGHIDNAFERVRYLEELQKIQRFVAQHPDLDHSTSIADLFALLNSAVNDTGAIELPYEDEVVETLMLFVGPDDTAEYLSDDHSKASILVRHGISDSKDLTRVLAELEQFLEKAIDEDLDTTITGESVLTENAVEYLMTGQLRSLMIVLATIFIVASLLFVTVKAGFIALIVNVYPIAALFAVMSFAGIPIDSATSMIAALGVGIGVDHTMHFMVRYNMYAKGGAGGVSAVAKTIRDESRPIGAATIALSAGFATLAISSFPPIYYFGLLSACVMLFSFVSTFLLAPVLLSYVRLNTLWEMLGTRVRHELQHECPLFRGMTTNQIRRVILQGRVNRYQDGEFIMQVGDSSNEMFVLLDGRVMIENDLGEGGQSKISVGSVGEVFGVAALTCGRPRIATAVSVGNATVVALNWKRLQGLARFFPRSAYILFRNLAMITGERLARQVTAERPKPPEFATELASVAPDTCVN